MDTPVEYDLEYDDPVLIETPAEAYLRLTEENQQLRSVIGYMTGACRWAWYRTALSWGADACEAFGIKTMDPMRRIPMDDDHGSY